MFQLKSFEMVSCFLSHHANKHIIQPENTAKSKMCIWNWISWFSFLHIVYLAIENLNISDCLNPIWNQFSFSFAPVHQESIKGSINFHNAHFLVFFWEWFLIKTFLNFVAQITLRKHCWTQWHFYHLQCCMSIPKTPSKLCN